MSYLKARLWIFLDKIFIKEKSYQIISDGQDVNIIEVKALFPWRCSALVQELMATHHSQPSRLYLNGNRLM